MFINDIITRNKNNTQQTKYYKFNCGNSLRGLFRYFRFWYIADIVKNKGCLL